MEESFSYVKRGYKPDEVNEYIKALKVVINSYSEKNDAIMNAIVKSQNVADEIIKQAEAEADKIKADTVQKLNVISDALDSKMWLIQSFQRHYGSLFQNCLPKFDDNDMSAIDSNVNEMKDYISNIKDVLSNKEIRFSDFCENINNDKEESLPLDNGKGELVEQLAQKIEDLDDINDIADIKNMLSNVEKTVTDFCETSNNDSEEILSIDKRKNELVTLLAQECRSLEDIHELLKNLFKSTIDQILETEMSECLNDVKHSSESSSYGKGEFDQELIDKHHSKPNYLERQIIAMYQKGMQAHDIEDYLRNMYGIDIPSALLIRITDKIMPQLAEWQSRSLDSVYPIIFFDGIMFKVRKNSKITAKCAYVVLGINMEGRKEILGVWLSENENESFWTFVLNELKNRGISDILIACRNKLNGLPLSIDAVFPKTEQQLSIIHQIRNSTKHVSSKDLNSVIADLKDIYQASSEEDALNYFAAFADKWDKKYPHISKSWINNWTDISVFFKYPEEIRRLIHTTNYIDEFSRMLREFTKTNRVYPSDDALKKSIYLSVLEIDKKWNIPVRDWGVITEQLSVFFEGRI